MWYDTGQLEVQSSVFLQYLWWRDHWIRLVICVGSKLVRYIVVLRYFCLFFPIAYYSTVRQFHFNIYITERVFKHFQQYNSHIFSNMTGWFIKMTINCLKKLYTYFRHILFYLVASLGPNYFDLVGLLDT